MTEIIALVLAIIAAIGGAFAMGKRTSAKDRTAADAKDATATAGRIKDARVAPDAVAARDSLRNRPDRR